MVNVYKCTCERCGKDYDIYEEDVKSENYEWPHPKHYSWTECHECNVLHYMLQKAFHFKSSPVKRQPGEIVELAEYDYVCICWLYFHSFSAASISLMYQVPESVIRSIILECRDEGMAKYQPVRDELLNTYNVDVTKPPQRPRTN